jgi:hypothetical protein
MGRPTLGYGSSDLVVGEVTPLARTKTVQVDGADSYAHQTQDGVACNRHHSTDLPVSTLAQNDAKEGALRSDALYIHEGAVGPLVLGDLHRLLELGEGGRARPASGFDDVLLTTAVAGMSDPLRPFAIGSQEEQSFAGHIQASYREEPRHFRDEIHHRGPALRIVRRGNEAGRFVEGQISLPFRQAHSNTVDGDLIRNWMDTRAQLLNHLAVYLDAASANQVLSVTA